MSENKSGLIQKIINLPTFNALRHKNFVLVFLSSITDSVGMYMSMVALGWLVLEMTDSPLSLGIVWATRSSPYLFFGVLAGAIADRYDRKMILILSHVILAAFAFLLGLLITQEGIQLWHILGITFLMGVINVINFPARQALAVDIVGREGAMNAISINAVGMRVIGVVGGAAAGFVVEYWGIDWPFYIMTASYLLGVSFLFLIRGVERVNSDENAEPQSTWKNFVEGIKLIGLNQVVLVLLIITAVCEILGFSYSVLLPVFARDVLNVGAVGLGMFYTAQSIGGLLGALGLASLGDFRRKGLLILCIFLTFGIALILFGQSPWYIVSLIVLALIGAMASGMDAMGHTILQLNVNDKQRGRAMGIWMMSIGFGPIGHLAIGAVAAAFSAQIAYTINGGAIILIFLLLFVLFPKLRKV
ncbi:MFS transporter [Chloroflexota bacterium]